MKFARSSFSVKATALVIGFLVAAVLSTGLIAYVQTSREIGQSLNARTNLQLRIAARLFAQFYPAGSISYDAEGEPIGIRGQGEKLDSLLLGSYGPQMLVDEITAITRGTATVFAYQPASKGYVRIATTIRKADGSPAIGTVLDPGGPVLPTIRAGRLFKGVANILGEPYQTGYMPITGKGGAPLGILYIGVGKLSELAATESTLVHQLALACAALLVLSILGATIVFRRFSAPIPQLAETTRRLTGGESTIAVPFTGRADEVGQLANSLVALGKALQERDRLRAAYDARAQEKDAQQAALQAHVDAFRGAVSQMLVRVREGSRAMASTSAALASIVDDAHGNAAAARQAADASAFNADSVAAASDQLRSSVAEIGSRTGQAVRMTGEATGVAGDSSGLVNKLARASEKIGEVIGAIRAIAEQTNLLALNATIEAARAGEAGRGFAVVAAEVKVLAGQTGTATNEIAAHIGAIQAITADVVRAFDEIGTGLDAINHVNASVAAAVEEQESATENISRNALHAADSAAVMREAMQGIEQVVERTREASGNMEALAGSFAQEAEMLVRSVDSFLDGVAA